MSSADVLRRAQRVLARAAKIAPANQPPAPGPAQTAAMRAQAAVDAANLQAGHIDQLSINALIAHARNLAKGFQ